MLDHILDNIGASLDNTLVPTLTVAITPSMITLESIWTRGDGTHLAKQRVITSALLHDDTLTNFVLSFADSRDKTRTVVKGQVTPDADVQSAKVRHRKLDAYLNFIDVDVGVAGHEIQMQLQGAPIPGVTYVHGIRLSIKKATPVKPVSAAVRDTLKRLTEMYPSTGTPPATPHVIVIQQPHPRPLMNPGIITSLGVYETAINTDIAQCRQQLNPSFMRILMGRPIKKVRYNK